jgi:hypothetical protein
MPRTHHTRRSIGGGSLNWRGPAAVKGGSSRRAAGGPLTASWRGGYQHNVRTLNLTISPRT